MKITSNMERRVKMSIDDLRENGSIIVTGKSCLSEATHRYDKLMTDEEYKKSMLFTDKEEIPLHEVLKLFTKFEGKILFAENEEEVCSLD